MVRYPPKAIVSNMASPVKQHETSLQWQIYSVFDVDRLIARLQANEKRI